jgi:ribonuclease-3
LTFDDFTKKAGIAFRNPSLLQRALTHRSYINEHPETLQDNERLEFLGDAALDFVTATWLYHRYPEMDEGDLTRLRSSLVRTEQLAEFAKELGLGEVLRLGRGEEASGGRNRPAILCDAFEAVIGALYLDSGLNAIFHFMETRFEQAADAVLEDEALLDPRSQLQIWAQAEHGETPRYETIASFGPDHEREFVVEVVVAEGLRGEGRGHSKQEAAQRAAANLLSQLNQYPSR